MNGDGWVDLFFANYQDGVTIDIVSYLYLGGPTGFSIGNRVELPTLGAYHPLIVDLDADGFEDLIVSQFRDLTDWTHESFVYWGGPAGYEVASRTALPTTGGYEVRTADFDSDGLLDVVFNGFQVGLGDYETDAVIWYQDAPRVFGTSDTLPTSGGSCAEVADFDGDGDVDLVLGNQLTNALVWEIDSYLYWNDGGFSVADRTALN